MDPGDLLRETAVRLLRVHPLRAGSTDTASASLKVTTTSSPTFACGSSKRWSDMRIPPDGQVGRAAHRIRGAWHRS